MTSLGDMFNPTYMVFKFEIPEHQICTNLWLKIDLQNTRFSPVSKTAVENYGAQQFWRSQIDHGFSFYLTNLWLCVCEGVSEHVCMYICVCVFVWVRVWQPWATGDGVTYQLRLWCQRPYGWHVTGKSHHMRARWLTCARIRRDLPAGGERHRERGREREREGGGGGRRRASSGEVANCNQLTADGCR